MGLHKPKLAIVSSFLDSPSLANSNHVSTSLLLVSAHLYSFTLIVCFIGSLCEQTAFHQNSRFAVFSASNNFSRILKLLSPHC